MRPTPPAISVTVESYAPGEWYYVARLHGLPVGCDEGGTMPDVRSGSQGRIIGSQRRDGSAERQQ